MKLSKVLLSDQPLLVHPEILRTHLDAALKSRESALSLKDNTQPHAQQGLSLVPKGMSFAEWLFGPTSRTYVENGVGVIEIRGPLCPGLAQCDKDMVATDTEEAAAWFLANENNPNVKAHFLDFDSPGGASIGIPEFGQLVANAKKPVVAFTDTQMDSAAYWLGSQADVVLATPSSYVGSVGVYIALENARLMYESFGVKVEVIKSGDLKGIGIRGTEMTDDQRNFLQERVNVLHSQFKAAVTSVRSTVAEDSMRGQSFSGSEAAARGLVTGLVQNRAQAFARAVR